MIFPASQPPACDRCMSQNFVPGANRALWRRLVVVVPGEDRKGIGSEVGEGYNEG